MKNRNGFSLLEILIALAIMLVGIVGTVGLFPVGLRASKVSGNITMATILGERVIESTKTGGLFPPSATTWAQFSSPYSNFWWQQLVTDPGISTNLRQIEVQIGWNDRGTAYSSNYISFFTYVANN